MYEREMEKLESNDVLRKEGMIMGEMWDEKNEKRIPVMEETLDFFRDSKDFSVRHKNLLWTISCNFSLSDVEKRERMLSFFDSMKAGNLREGLDVMFGCEFKKERMKSKIDVRNLERNGYITIGKGIENGKTIPLMNRSDKESYLEATSEFRKKFEKNEMTIEWSLNYEFHEEEKDMFENILHEIRNENEKLDEAVKTMISVFRPWLCS